MILFFNFLEFGLIAWIFLVGTVMISKFSKAGFYSPPVLSGTVFIALAIILALNNRGVFLYYFAS